jgi:hypothetical protein
MTIATERDSDYSSSEANLTMNLQLHDGIVRNYDIVLLIVNGSSDAKSGLSRRLRVVANRTGCTVGKVHGIHIGHRVMLTAVETLFV